MTGCEETTLKQAMLPYCTPDISHIKLELNVIQALLQHLIVITDNNEVVYVFKW